VSALDLLTRFRRRPRPEGSRADDHVPAAEHAAQAGECDHVTPAAPTPSEPSQRREPKPATIRAPLTSAPRPVTPSAPASGKLAALTPALGRQKAGQALWAPHLLSASDRRQAEQILRELRDGHL
jgi:hypothetical protein